jgi:hypothetical protein
MRSGIQGVAAVSLLAIGYLLGASGVLRPLTARAQEEADLPTKETIDKIKAAHEALNSAMLALETEKRYQAATKGVNAFAVSVGGVDALADLETRRGVDPETFAGLYAGLAVDEVKSELGHDEQGRLTYKNEVVRLYPISRLKKLFADRAKILGEEDGK